ncbi:MAG: hypothetical protein ACR2J5_00885 [Geodermatophilaceae bacterium]
MRRPYQELATSLARSDRRFWVALGTGDASNEHITGEGWPRKEVRNARLQECVDIIRARPGEVAHAGAPVVREGR